MGDLLGIHEVAERLHSSRHTVYRLVRAKAIPFVKLTPRGRLFFRASAVDAWLAKIEVAPGAPAAVKPKASSW